jgi:hypothetical protein
MKTIVETILSGGSAEFTWHGESYLIQQESNKGCHYLCLWRLTPQAACLCRVCFEVFDGVSEETVEELFDQQFPDGHTVRDMLQGPENGGRADCRALDGSGVEDVMD